MCDYSVTTVYLDTPLSTSTKCSELIGETGKKDNECLFFSFKVSLSFLLPSEPLKFQTWDFPGSPVVKNRPSSVGNMGLIPGLGRSHMLQSNYAHEPQ